MQSAYCWTGGDAIEPGAESLIMSQAGADKSMIEPLTKHGPDY
jgi:hypothetical protein